MVCVCALAFFRGREVTSGKLSLQCKPSVMLMGAAGWRSPGGFFSFFFPFPKTNQGTLVEG